MPYDPTRPINGEIVDADELRKADTAPAAVAAFPTTMQVPRRIPQLLSLGSFGAAALTLS